MKLNKVLLCICIIIITLCIFLSACNSPKNTASDDNTVKTSIDDLNLKDSSVIYKNDNELSVVTMYLTVSQGNSADNTDHTWEEINAHSVYYYDENNLNRYRVEGILQVGDENGPTAGSFGYGEFSPNCSVQIRGKTSTRSPQKSYKIDIRKNEGYWREQRTIDLNKHVYDSVRFRNKLSYDILKTIPGAFSARTQFVHLYVKDLSTGNNDVSFADYGLYTQVEQINKSYLRNHGLDENGQLYKANMFEYLRYEDDLKLTTDPDYDKSAFEKVLEIKGNDDHSKLIAMLKDLNNYSIPIETTFKKYFDEDNYFTWIAFQMLSGNTDTTTQNFFLYSPQNGTKWYIIPWDNDDAWNYEEDILFGNETDGYNYTLGVSNYWGSVLHQRILKSETYRKKLDDKINEIRKLITKQLIEEKANEYSAITKKYLSVLPDSFYAPKTMAEFDKIIPTISSEFDYRYAMYQTSLECPMPFYVTTPAQTGGKTVFTWDPSFDFDHEKITYKFELAKDYLFKTVLSSQDNLAVPQAMVDLLAPGQYFFKVTATNESGKTQTAMETYQGEDDVKRYGVVGFYVKADGTVQLIA